MIYIIQLYSMFSFVFENTKKIFSCFSNIELGSLEKERERERERERVIERERGREGARERER